MARRRYVPITMPPPHLARFFAGPRTGPRAVAPPGLRPWQNTREAGREGVDMPRKKREIRADLARHGFARPGGKGDHTVWVHPLLSGHVSIDGKDGDDAKPYDERNLRRVLHDLAQAQAKQQAKQSQQPSQQPGSSGKQGNQP